LWSLFFSSEICVVSLGDHSEKERILSLLLFHHHCHWLMVYVNQVEAED
jgi:hypothetical protein